LEIRNFDEHRIYRDAFHSAAQVDPRSKGSSRLLGLRPSQMSALACLRPKLNSRNSKISWLAMTLLPASSLATRLWRFWEYFKTWSSGKHELSYEWRRLGQRHFYYWQNSWYLKSRASKYVQSKVKSRQRGCDNDNRSAEVQWHGRHAMLADTVK
jgi:hypothetical protein